MTPHPHANFYCGTSNVELPVPNKSFFPDAFLGKSRLNYYASLFNSVEINSSFYKIPLRRTVEKWMADVPDDFRFTFKLWKGITHTRGFVYDAADVERFLDAVNGIGAKKGCLLVQLPASIDLSYFTKLKKLLDELKDAQAADHWKLAVEFRDRSWYVDRTYELLYGYHAAVVIHDMPKSATPLADRKTEHIYLRFHGERGDYRGSYDEAHLHRQAVYIQQGMEHGATIFAYFNNTIGSAVQNALLLQKKVDR